MWSFIYLVLSLIAGPKRHGSKRHYIYQEYNIYLGFFCLTFLFKHKNHHLVLLFLQRIFLFLDRSASFDAGSFVVTAEWQELHHLMNIHNKLMFITLFMSVLFNPSSAYTLRITMNSWNTGKKYLQPLVGSKIHFKL